MNDVLNYLLILGQLQSIKFNISYLDENNEVISTETQTQDLLQNIEDTLKQFLGSSEYNKWKHKIDITKQTYNIPDIVLPLKLKNIDVNVQFDTILNPTVTVPTLSVSSTYENNLQKSIVTVNITNYDSSYIYEIQYTYDTNGTSGWTSLFTSDSSIDINVIPNKNILVRARSKKLNATSNWSSNYSVLTARDTTPPQQPVVLSNIAKYKSTVIELQEPTEEDFDYFYIQFNLNNETHIIKSKTNIIEVSLGEVYNNVDATLYQVDTSGNTSSGTQIQISSLDFTQQESAINNTISSTQNTISLLNDSLNITGTISQITSNIITTTADLTNVKHGHIILIEHDGNVYSYEIESADTGTGQIVLSQQPNQSVGDNFTIASQIQGQHIQINKTSDSITSVAQKLKDTYIEHTFDGTDITISTNVITDNTIDFESSDEVDIGYVVTIEYNDGSVLTTKITDILQQHQIQLRDSIDTNKTQNKYKIYSQASFVSSNITQTYDSILQTVQETNFDILLTGSPTQIDSQANKLEDTNANFSTIPVNQIVRLSDGKRIWYYTATQIQQNYLILDTNDLFDSFDTNNLQYEIYKPDSIIQSAIAQTQKEISTSILNTEAGLQSSITQLADEIALRVVAKDETGTPQQTSLTIKDGKIQIDQDNFEVTGDALISGTLDASKVNIQAGNQTIDDKGIHVLQGDIKLGKDQNSGEYQIKLEDTGSGHLAKGNISWDDQGNQSFAGTINVTGGNLSGLKLDADKIYLGSGTHQNSDTSFYVDQLGNFSIKDTFIYDGTNLKIKQSDFLLYTTGASGEVSQSLSINDSGQIILDQNNTTISGDAIIQGTLTFDKMDDSIQKSRFELELSKYTINQIKNTVLNQVTPQSVDVDVSLIDRTNDQLQNYTITVDSIVNNGATWSIDDTTHKVTLDLSSLTGDCELTITATESTKNFTYSKTINIQYSEYKTSADYKIIQLNGFQIQKDETQINFKIMKKYGTYIEYISNDQDNIGTVYKLEFADDGTQVSYDQTNKYHYVQNNEINGTRNIVLKVNIDGTWYEFDNIKLYDLIDPVGNLIINHNVNTTTLIKKWNSSQNDYDQWDKTRIDGTIQFFYQGQLLTNDNLTVHQEYTDMIGNTNTLTLTYDSQTKSYSYSITSNDQWQNGVLSISVSQDYSIPNTSNTVSQQDIINITCYVENAPKPIVRIISNNGTTFKTGYDLSNLGIENTTLTCETENIKNPTYTWKISSDGGTTYSTITNQANELEISNNILTVYWNYVKDYDSLLIKCEVTGDNISTEFAIINIINLKEYKPTENYYVKLEQDTYTLDYDTTEAIVTARVYLKGQEVTDLTDWTFTFTPDGDQTGLQKNQRKYTVDDVNKLLTIEVDVTCDNPQLLI